VAKASLSIDDCVTRVVDEAPELTPEQVGRLAALLRPAPITEPKDRAA
jgi:hypothetical protein